MLIYGEGKKIISSIEFMDAIEECQGRTIRAFYPSFALFATSRKDLLSLNTPPALSRRVRLEDRLI